MAVANVYPQTHQGVRNLDNPMTASGRGQNVGGGERVASVLLGGLGAGYGLARGDLTGLAIAALTTGLICRGVTGHCAVYQAAGINTAR